VRDKPTKRYIQAHPSRPSALPHIGMRRDTESQRLSVGAHSGATSRRSDTSRLTRRARVRSHTQACAAIPNRISSLWERTRARQANEAIHPGSPVAHECAPTHRHAPRHRITPALCGSALVRDKPTKRYIQAHTSRTSALPHTGMRRDTESHQLSVGAHLGATSRRSDTSKLTRRAQLRSHNRYADQVRVTSKSSNTIPCFAWVS